MAKQILQSDEARKALKSGIDKAGDGTTTSIVLFQAMVRDGLKRIGPAVNPMVVRAGMEQGLKDAVDALNAKSMKREISSKQEIKQVATIASESEDLGEIIADVMEK